jgi:hypothetical protein
MADGRCWFALREKYCWLAAGGWFVVREKYCWLVADKPSEQAVDAQYGLHKLVLGKTFDDHYLTVAKKKQNKMEFSHLYHK